MVKKIDMSPSLAQYLGYNKSRGKYICDYKLVGHLWGNYKRNRIDIEIWEGFQEEMTFRKKFTIDSDYPDGELRKRLSQTEEIKQRANRIKNKNSAAGSIQLSEETKSSDY